MRRGINPLAVIMLLASGVLAFAVAILVRHILPKALMGWSGLIFWGIVILIGGFGAILAGRFINRR